MKLLRVAIFWLLTLITHRQLSATPTRDPRYRYESMTTDAAKAASRSYDYIVVGGGTAGIPLATTLSEKYSVLLLERGGSPYGNPDIEIAQREGSPLTKMDKYTSVAQEFITEDGVSLARARVLGGGTCINAGFYSRSSSEDLRRMGLDKKLALESYEWVEQLVTFKPNQLSQWNTAFRDALIKTGVLPYYGFTLDHVEGSKISSSIFDNYGVRHTTADILKAANPSNIVVLLNATVSKIFFHSKSGKLKARGVEFISTEDGQSHQVFTKASSPRSEVFVSAGSIGSTQLLLLSGIGPSQQLKQLDIPVLLDLPSVGKRVQDNPIVHLGIVSPKPLEFSAVQVAAIINNSQVYIETGSQLNLTTSEYFGGMLEKVAYPLSRGEIQLRNTDPRDNPSVRYNYYSHPVDLQRCVEGVRALTNLLETDSFQQFAFSPNSVGTTGFRFVNVTLPSDTLDDAGVAKFCQDSLASIYHFHGGCNIGSVVDEKFRVKGVDGLRIVDASIFESSPGTNPQATIMMLGRYLGMKILGERSFLDVELKVEAEVEECSEGEL